MTVTSAARALLAAFFILAAGAARAAGEGADDPMPPPDFAAFAAWRDAVVAEARSRGYGEGALRALRAVEPVPRVIELDRRQPEFTLTFDDYMARVVPDARVEKARQKFAEYRDLLDRTETRYGVEGRYLVAFWAIETDFGRVQGVFPVLSSLATLAYDRRRPDFFRKELFHALTIIDEDHIAPDAMLGSWAGAMGQPQFLPSSFVRFAVDANGDGRRDIWSTPADVFASAANYLSQSGWKPGEPWGEPIVLPEKFDMTLVGYATRKPRAEWAALGLTRPDGAALPADGRLASVIFPRAEGSPPFLIYDNFETILKWNRSSLYAVAVGSLADRIAAD